MKKTTSKELSKKITRYTALSAAMASVANLNAQNGYTDVDPNVTISLNHTDNQFTVDMDPLNSNGPEFRLYVNSYSANIVGLTSSASILGAASGIYDFVFALDSNELISNGLTSWFSNGAYRTLNLYYSSNCYGQWCDVTKFVGVKFNISGNTHYGWIRLTVPTDPNDGVTILDYFYNTTPDACAIAGNNNPLDTDGDGWPDICDPTPLDIENNAFSNIKIIALNKTIALYNLPEQTNYKVFNMSGQQILDGKIQNKTHVIEANTLANGIYIVELQDADTNTVIRKKVVL